MTTDEARRLADWSPEVGKRYLDTSRPRWVEVVVTEVGEVAVQLGDDGRYSRTAFDPDHSDYRFQYDGVATLTEQENR